MKKRSTMLMAVALAFATVPVLAAEDDPFVGTWKLNVEKSKFSPGPAPKSSTVTIEPGGKVSVHSVGAKGEDETWSFTAVQGEEATITGMEGGTVVEKRSERTVDHVWKTGTEGKMTGRGVISKNGKRMTYTLDGTNGQGQTVHNVEIYEKE
ncbi:MAG TPA: hypothetical protein VHA11_01580 [Bryobacteraceae bacterium]|nr:hypothetical protein [Bryobacteraceae bacterium]